MTSLIEAPILQKSASETPWGASWRALLPQITADCTKDQQLGDQVIPGSCTISSQCEHQTLSPEWAEAFDQLSDLTLCNKFIAAGGEGSAKTHSSALFLTCRYAYDRLTVRPAPVLYWFIGNDFEDAYPEFEDTARFMESLGWIKGEAKVRNGGKERCEFETIHGTRFVTVSANKPQKVGRETVDGIIACEPSLWARETFDRAMGRIARKPTAWLFGGGSFETDRDQGFNVLFQEGQAGNSKRLRSMAIPSFANRHLYPGGGEDPRILELAGMYSTRRFKERVLGEPAPPKGQVIVGLDPAIHLNPWLMPNPAEPVYLFIDPGTLIYCILFCQISGPQIKVLGEIYQEQADSRRVIERALMHPMWRYVRSHKGHWMDSAGKQRHLGSKAPISVWKQLTGLEISTSKGTVEVDTKVERCLALLNRDYISGTPYLQINSKECPGLLAEAGIGPSPAAEQGGGIWMRQVNERGEVGNVQRKNDHAWSALAYGALGHFGVTAPGRKKARRVPLQYESGGFGDVTGSTPLIDYEAFPGTTKVREDGSVIRLPGKRFSQVGQRYVRRLPRTY